MAGHKPTELELDILKIVWRDGAMTVRTVRDALAPTRDLAYTSVMTMMTIMVKKGYLRRRKQGSGYLYHATVSQAETTGKMLGDMVDRVFGDAADRGRNAGGRSVGRIEHAVAVEEVAGRVEDVAEEEPVAGRSADQLIRQGGGTGRVDGLEVLGKGCKLGGTHRGGQTQEYSC